MFRIYFLFLFLFLHFSSQSQEIEWQNTIGGDNLEEQRAVIQTVDGGYIVGGYSYSGISGDKTEGLVGSVQDYWILKLNGSGNIQWQNDIGGGGADNLSTMAPTSDGGCIIGGGSTSNSFGDKSENCWGDYDFWIVKLDDVGNIQWDNTIGGNWRDVVTSIYQTIDGGYICGGYSNSGISGDKTEASQGSYDYWIIKLDSSGNIIWQNTIGGNDDDILASIIQTSDGGYACGGYSLSTLSGDKTEASSGLEDYWIIKLDSLGNIQWQNTIGGNAEDYLNSMANTSDVGIICGGRSRSTISGDKNEDSQGQTDYWVIRLDSLGNILWQNTIGGNNWDDLYSITQAMDGGFICGGFSISNPSGDKTEYRHGRYDFWIVKLDSSGNLLKQKAIGGTLDDKLYSMFPTSDGGVICGGTSESENSIDKSENCMGYRDYWIVKLTDKFNSVQGKTFVDINSNSLHDTGEPILRGMYLTEINSGRPGISNQIGEYSLSVLDSGNFTVAPSGYLQHYTAVPQTHNVYFSSFQQIDSLNDFAFQPSGTINDLEITITPVSMFRPGFHAYYNIQYKNTGTTALAGSVIFYIDSNITYVSASVPPSLVSADSVVWQTSVLNPFDEGNLFITATVNTGTPLGTMINSCAVIHPVIGDATPVNNTDCWEVPVTVPIDPNDILVDRATVTTIELLNPPFLEFLIRFQNTGNDTAFNVWIQNNVTEMLNLSTFELVSASHPVNITYQNHSRLLTFQFVNILLPDSNVNEPASYGFVRYRVKPLSTLTAGDSIKNKAYIYFDFNDPVETNTAVTEIVLPSFIPSLKNEFDFTISPNPATNYFTVSLILKDASEARLFVFNALGQSVFTKQEQLSSGKKEFLIATDGFPQGIYYVKIDLEKCSGIKKLVKM